MYYLCDDIIYLIGEEVKKIRRIEELKKILPPLQNNIRDKQFINKFNEKTRMMYCINDQKLDYIFGKDELLVIDYNNCEYKYKFKIKKKGYITIRDILNTMMKQNFYLDNEQYHDDHLFIERIKQYNKIRNKNPNKDICKIICGS